MTSGSVVLSSTQCHPAVAHGKDGFVSVAHISRWSQGLLRKERLLCEFSFYFSVVNLVRLIPAREGLQVWRNIGKRGFERLGTKSCFQHKRCKKHYQSHV